MHELEGDDWLPATAPKFDELPPKPRPEAEYWCFVSSGSRPVWRRIKDGRAYDSDGLWQSGNLRIYTIIPHPENDEEAMRMIREAKNS
jgi:hypothetical protein